jgi:hypothetical protein
MSFLQVDGRFFEEANSARIMEGGTVSLQEADLFPRNCPISFLVFRPRRLDLGQADRQNCSYVTKSERPRRSLIPSSHVHEQAALR